MGAWVHEEPLSRCRLAQASLVFDLGWRIRSGSYSLLEKTCIIGTRLGCGAYILLAVAVRKQ